MFSLPAIPRTPQQTAFWVYGSRAFFSQRRSLPSVIAGCFRETFVNLSSGPSLVAPGGSVSGSSIWRQIRYHSNDNGTVRYHWCDTGMRAGRWTRKRGRLSVPEASPCLVEQAPCRGSPCQGLCSPLSSHFFLGDRHDFAFTAARLVRLPGARALEEEGRAWHPALPLLLLLLPPKCNWS